MTKPITWHIITVLAVLIAVFVDNRLVAFLCGFTALVGLTLPSALAEQRDWEARRAFYLNLTTEGDSDV